MNNEDRPTIEILPQNEEDPRLFTIAVTALKGEWPEPCSGAFAVLTAVQKMLEAASDGNAADFSDARYDAENSIDKWYHDLFGIGGTFRE